MEKYYVTTAIAYPNGKPHLGHALEIVQADVVACLACSSSQSRVTKVLYHRQ